MSYHEKAKAKGISASSFFDLKAELSKKESEFTRNKGAGPSSARPDKVRSKQVVRLMDANQCPSETYCLESLK